MVIGRSKEDYLRSPEITWEYNGVVGDDTFWGSSSARSDHQMLDLMTSNPTARFRGASSVYMP
jgi:hypothetical protein